MHTIKQVDLMKSRCPVDEAGRHFNKHRLFKEEFRSFTILVLFSTIQLWRTMTHGKTLQDVQHFIVDKLHVFSFLFIHPMSMASSLKECSHVSPNLIFNFKFELFLTLKDPRVFWYKTAQNYPLLKKNL
jgi:hypothetical protein